MQAQDQETAPPLRTRVRNEIMDWVKTLAWVIPVYLIFTTVAFANYSIPSESMVPTLEVGDRVVVSKYAYGYSRHSLPLSIGNLLPASEHRLFEQMPKRGDVAVFIHPQEDKVMIKRLIGLPGDRIEVRGGVLSVNGEPVALSESQSFTREAYQMGPEDVTSYEETLPGGVRHAIHKFPQGSRFDDFGPYQVPAGHFFFMGDNRDNSLDSRFVGMGSVPFENLIGRAEMIYWALDLCRPDDVIACPRSRWFRALHD